MEHVESNDGNIYCLKEKLNIYKSLHLFSLHSGFQKTSLRNLQM